MKNQQEYLAAVVKNLPARAGDVRDGVSIPRLRRTCGQGNDNPLQYSGLMNSKDCVVHEIAKSQTQLSYFKKKKKERKKMVLN